MHCITSFVILSNILLLSSATNESSLIQELQTISNNSNNTFANYSYVLPTEQNVTALDCGDDSNSSGSEDDSDTTDFEIEDNEDCDGDTDDESSDDDIIYEIIVDDMPRFQQMKDNEESENKIEEAELIQDKSDANEEDSDSFLKIERNFQTVYNFSGIQSNPWESILDNKVETTVNVHKLKDLKEEKVKEVQISSSIRIIPMNASFTLSSIKTFPSPTKPVETDQDGHLRATITEVTSIIPSTSTSQVKLHYFNHIEKEGHFLIGHPYALINRTTTLTSFITIKETSTQFIHKPPRSGILTILPIGPPSTMIQPEHSTPFQISLTSSAIETEEAKIMTKLHTTTVAITVGTTVTNKVTTTLVATSPIQHMSTKTIHVQSTETSSSTATESPGLTTSLKVTNPVSKVFSSGMDNEFHPSHISSILHKSQTEIPSQTITRESESIPTETNSSKSDETIPVTTKDSEVKPGTTSESSTSSTVPNEEKHSQDEKGVVITEFESKTEESLRDSSTSNDRAISTIVQVANPFTGVVVPERQFVLKSWSTSAETSSTLGVMVLMSFMFLIL